MKVYNLCVLGFGNVSRALLRLLEKKTPDLREQYGIGWRLTGIATRRMGWIADANGLDAAALLAGDTALHGPVLSVKLWLEAARADVLFELTSLNPSTGQPAIDHIRAALETSVHAITANKGPVVHAYHELRTLAAAKGKRFMFEATVMDGAPIFSLFRKTLPAARLLGFRGVLNSTTNYILTAIEAGSSLEEAVEQAQALGISETDPGADINGWDAAVKVAALVTVLMDTPLKPDQIEREGILSLEAATIRAARAAGKPYKLVCRAKRQGDQVRTSIRPEQVPLGDPLASVNGTSSVIHFELDTLPGLTITEHDPRPETTAYGLLADFINAARHG